MIELDQHEGTYLNICRHYRAVYETPSVRDSSEEKLRILKHVVLFVVLSPYNNEQVQKSGRNVGKTSHRRVTLKNPFYNFLYLRIEVSYISFKCHKLAHFSSIF